MVKSVAFVAASLLVAGCAGNYSVYDQALARQTQAVAAQKTAAVSAQQPQFPLTRRVVPAVSAYVAPKQISAAKARPAAIPTTIPARSATVIQPSAALRNIALAPARPAMAPAENTQVVSELVAMVLEVEKAPEQAELPIVLVGGIEPSAATPAPDVSAEDETTPAEPTENTTNAAAEIAKDDAPIAAEPEVETAAPMQAEARVATETQPEAKAEDAQTVDTEAQSAPAAAEPAPEAAETEMAEPETKAEPSTDTKSEPTALAVPAEKPTPKPATRPAPIIPNSGYVIKAGPFYSRAEEQAALSLLRRAGYATNKETQARPSGPVTIFRIKAHPTREAATLTMDKLLARGIDWAYIELME